MILQPLSSPTSGANVSARLVKLLFKLGANSVVNFHSGSKISGVSKLSLTRIE